MYSAWDWGSRRTMVVLWSARMGARSAECEARRASAAVSAKRSDSIKLKNCKSDSQWASRKSRKAATTASSACEEAVAVVVIAVVAVVVVVVPPPSTGTKQRFLNSSLSRKRCTRAGNEGVPTKRRRSMRPGLTMAESKSSRRLVATKKMHRRAWRRSLSCVRRAVVSILDSTDFVARSPRRSRQNSSTSSKRTTVSWSFLRRPKT
mmetsp:Transcript_30968/g.99907  ORF Transcript_30968/g.99907 Transcript_30968/m.99907 type:complete len:206 (+) Transcript_30968:412-1029(+)